VGQAVPGAPDTEEDVGKLAMDTANDGGGS